MENTHYYCHDLKVCDYRQGIDWITTFVEHLYTQLVTKSNYNAIADVHTLQIITAHAKHFPACCVLTSRSLATASNTGDSSATRAQVFPSPTVVRDGLPAISSRKLNPILCCNWQLTRCHLFSVILPMTTPEPLPIIFNCRYSTNSQLSLGPSLVLRSTVSRPVCIGIKNPSGDYDQMFITVRHLRVCWCGALSLTRGRAYRLQLLLAVASALIFEFESRGTRDHTLLSQIPDSSFCRLLRLAGIRWRYSTWPGILVI
jgi:hypothetical protein